MLTSEANVKLFVLLLLSPDWKGWRPLSNVEGVKDDSRGENMSDTPEYRPALISGMIIVCEHTACHQHLLLFYLLSWMCENEPINDMGWDKH